MRKKYYMQSIRFLFPRKKGNPSRNKARLQLTPKTLNPKAPPPKKTTTQNTPQQEQHTKTDNYTQNQKNNTKSPALNMSLTPFAFRLAAFHPEANFRRDPRRLTGALRAAARRAGPSAAAKSFEKLRAARGAAEPGRSGGRGVWGAGFGARFLGGGFWVPVLGGGFSEAVFGVATCGDRFFRGGFWGAVGLQRGKHRKKYIWGLAVLALLPPFLVGCKGETEGGVHSRVASQGKPKD